MPVFIPSTLFTNETCAANKFIVRKTREVSTISKFTVFLGKYSDICICKASEVPLVLVYFKLKTSIKFNKELDFHWKPFYVFPIYENVSFRNYEKNLYELV